MIKWKSSRTLTLENSHIIISVLQKSCRIIFLKPVVSCVSCWCISGPWSAPSTPSFSFNSVHGVWGLTLCSESFNSSLEGFSIAIVSTFFQVPFHFLVQWSVSPRKTIVVFLVFKNKIIWLVNLVDLYCRCVQSVESGVWDIFHVNVKSFITFLSVRWTLFFDVPVSSSLLVTTNPVQIYMWTGRIIVW